jgi:hypothetical protein
MPLSSGTKIHVIERRLFDGDIRRHFVGEIEAVANSVARARGWTFVHDPGKSGYVRSRREQIRIVPLTDAHLTIRILPLETRIADVAYRAEGNRTIVTDGSFELEIADFGAHR